MGLRIGKPEDVNMQAQRVSLMKKRVQSWVDGEMHSALVVMVARRGKIVVQEAFGHLSAEPDSPLVQLDTIFPIASQSKIITATAIMVLVEEARLGLHRQVAEYIPEFTGPGKEMVMIHHLLTHTSGLVDSVIDLHMIKKTQTSDLSQLVDNETTIIDTYLAFGYDAPLTCPPGQRQYYSFYGFELLGEIIKRVSGNPLADFAHERIFSPLGMSDSWYIVPETVLDRIVTRPVEAPLAYPDSPTYEWVPAMMQPLIGTELPLLRQLPWAVGGVYSTAPDMLRFGQMLLNQGHFEGQRILSPASVGVMTRNQIPGIGSWWGEVQLTPEASYGYALSIAGDTHFLINPSLISPTTYGHTGGGGTCITIDPERELVILYYSVELAKDPLGVHLWNNDLFVNGIISAVLD